MKGKVLSPRQWIAGGAVSAVLLAALGWFLLVSPELSSVSSLKSQTADVNLQNTTTEHKVTLLRKQNDQLATLTTTLSQKTEELPSDSSVQVYTRQLVAQAALSGVALTSITAGAPTISNGNAVASTAVAGANPAGKLFAIPISITGQGSLAGQRALITAIQKAGPRRALVTSVQFAPSTATKAQNIDASTQMTLQLSIFVAPQTPDAEAALEKQLAHK
jgi:hypothetical protein